MDGQEDDAAFTAFENTLRQRSVLDVEIDRVAKGYPADYALQKHGRTTEEEIMHSLLGDLKMLMADKPSAEILAFPVPAKRDE